MMHQEFLSTLHLIAIYFPVLVFVFTFRGFFKALTAKLMGDDTPQQEGFLTLNPVAHVDVFGLVVTMGILLLLGVLFSGTFPQGFLILLLIVLGVRWTIPLVVDSRNFKYYRLGGVLTSLAGSAGNFLLATCTLLCYKFLPIHKASIQAQKTIIDLMVSLIDVSIWFGIVDLIPVPPFDGGKMVYYLLPQSYQYIYEWLEDYALFIILFLFFMPFVSDYFWASLSVAMALVKGLLIRMII